MQLQLSTAASLRANWLGIINVDVLAMADSEDKLRIAHHHHDNIVYTAATAPDVEAAFRSASGKRFHTTLDMVCAIAFFTCTATYFSMI